MLPVLRRIFLPLALLIALVGLPLPAASQEGRGAIFEGNVIGSQNIGALNPLLCDNPACRRVTDLLFPHLIGIDSAAGVYTPTGDSTALAKGWKISADGKQYRFQLRDDLKWNDGIPVTAFDVFYSYLALVGTPDIRALAEPVRAIVAAVIPLDSYTILFTLRQASCTALDNLNLSIIPAHGFAPGLTQQAAGGFPALKLLLSQFVWAQGERRTPVSLSARDPINLSPEITAGAFNFERLQPTEDIRLSRDDGQLGFDYIDVPDRRTEVALFLNGDLNLIINPPLDLREDIRAAADVHLFEYPGTTWDGIALNLADPENPQSAYDDQGLPLDQGHHPVFSDPQVRRAVQLAIDVNALIEAAVLGNATAIPANQPPGSWAFNADLSLSPYDPAEAQHLLEQAGWKDINRDGFRECWGCLYTQPGKPLEFELLYSYSIPRHAVMAEIIREQLAQVGIMVHLNDGGDLSPDGLLRQQRYDAYLFQQVEGYPVNPDQWAMFSRTNDRIGDGWNVNSYTNPEVDRFLSEARVTPGCDTAARAKNYREVQALLQADQPYIWLFALNEMIAARGGVLGFDPHPYAPFWNIQDWRVIR